MHSWKIAGKDRLGSGAGQANAQSRGSKSREFHVGLEQRKEHCG